jgi:hypothetical protein
VLKKCVREKKKKKKKKVESQQEGERGVDSGSAEKGVEERGLDAIRTRISEYEWNTRNKRE